MTLYKSMRIDVKLETTIRSANGSAINSRNMAVNLGLDCDEYEHYDFRKQNYKATRKTSNQY